MNYSVNQPNETNSNAANNSGYPVNTALAETLETGTKKKKSVFYNIGGGDDYKSEIEEAFGYLTSTFKKIVAYRDFSEHFNLESFTAEYEEKMINNGKKDSEFSKAGGILIVPFLGEGFKGKEVAISATRNHESGRHGINKALVHSSKDIEETKTFITELL